MIKEKKYGIFIFIFFIIFKRVLFILMDSVCNIDSLNLNFLFDIIVILYFVLFSTKTLEKNVKEFDIKKMFVILGTSLFAIYCSNQLIHFLFRNFEQKQVPSVDSLVLKINLATIVLTTISGPIQEEILYRYYLLHDNLTSKKIMLVVSAFLFSSAHGLNDPASFLILLVNGLIFGSIFLKTNNLIYSIIVHMGNNLFAMLMTML